jgi:hypothetical protein
LFGTGPGSASQFPAPASTSTFALPVGSKLTTYLDSDHVSQFDNSFSILSWWHDHKITYPILSLCGRVIKEHRQSLTSEHIEMSVLKDWEQGDTQQQHNMEDKKLEDKMANLDLNGHGPDGAPAGA